MNIKEFKALFPTEDACLDHIFSLRYPKLKGYKRLKGRKGYFKGQRQIYPLKGTILEGSRTPLTAWFYVIYLFSQSKNGVSAKEVQRHLGITYKAAFRMGHQIRQLMKQGFKPLQGVVEADETYYGGRRRNKKSKAFRNKSPIMGMVERGGLLRARVLPNRDEQTILREVKNNINRGAEVMTDDFPTYRRLTSMGYKRSWILHSQGRYVDGEIHTNTIEGFWSQVKRNIRGTYVSVSKQHLQSYVNEFAFRYNYRHGAFQVLLERIALYAKGR